MINSEEKNEENRSTTEVPTFFRLNLPCFSNCLGDGNRFQQSRHDNWDDDDQMPSSGAPAYGDQWMDASADDEFVMELPSNKIGRVIGNTNANSQKNISIRLKKISLDMPNEN